MPTSAYAMLAAGRDLVLYTGCTWSGRCPSSGPWRSTPGWSGGRSQSPERRAGDRVRFEQGRPLELGARRPWTTWTRSRPKTACSSRAAVTSTSRQARARPSARPRRSRASRRRRATATRCRAPTARCCTSPVTAATWMDRPTSGWRGASRSVATARPVPGDLDGGGSNEPTWESPDGCALYSRPRAPGAARSGSAGASGRREAAQGGTRCGSPRRWASARSASRRARKSSASSGSNWVPAQRSISATATSCLSARR
jgi:hypothetical protein